LNSFFILTGAETKSGVFRSFFQIHHQSSVDLFIFRAFHVKS